MPESPRRLRLDGVAAAFLADCRARQLSPHTLEHYRGSIDSFRRFLGPKPGGHVVADLAIDGARAWAAALAATRSPGSVGDAIAGLKVFSHWLVTEGLVRSDLLGQLRKPRAQAPLIRPFERDQMAILLRAAPPHLAIVLRLLLDTGLRISEALALRIEDVRDGIVYVRHGKGDRERVVPYGRSLDAALRRYLNRERRFPVRDPHEPLFLNTRGDPLRPKAVAQALRRIALEHRISGVRVSPHTFRHTFATEFLRNGGGELALQRALGVADLSMVRRYAEVTNVDLTAAHAVASPLDHWRADLGSRVPR